MSLHAFYNICVFLNSGFLVVHLKHNVHFRKCVDKDVSDLENKMKEFS